MQIKILLTLTMLAAAQCSFSQDTTGGTRPTLVIPLHRSKTKTSVVKTTTEYPAEKTIMPVKKKSAKKRGKVSLKTDQPSP